MIVFLDFSYQPSVQWINFNLVWLHVMLKIINISTERKPLILPHPSFKWKLCWFFVARGLIFTWLNYVDLSAIYAISCCLSFFGSPTCIFYLYQNDKYKKNICLCLSSPFSFSSHPFTLNTKSPKPANNRYLKVLNFTSFHPLYMLILITKESSLNS